MTSAADVLVGIDAGTTFVKACVLAPDGVELAHGRSPTPWRTVATGAEVDPNALVDAALEAMRRALEGLDDVRVRAAGVTSMAETGALLDTSGAPVAPAIAWYDRRGEGQAARLARHLGDDAFTMHTGLRPTRVCSLSKLLWLRANVPESRRGARWLNVAEWIVRALGGDEVAELSLASRTGALDIVARSWWDDALDCTGAPGTLMPALVPAGTPAGTAARGPNALLGATLTVAGHDHLCAAVGVGTTRSGDVLNSCGTAEAFVRVVDPPSRRAELLRARDLGLTTGAHVLDRRGALMGGFTSGGALSRILERLGVTSDEARARLDRTALEVAPWPGGIDVLENSAEHSVADFAIPEGALPEQVWRSALEEITEHGAGVLGGIEQMAGPVRRIVVTGGWASNPALRALKRRRLGAFDHPAIPEAGARGAALIAGSAAGIYDSIDAAASAKAREC